MLAEGGDGESVERFGQRAAADQRVGDVVGDALVGGEIVRLDVGDQRRQPRRRHAFALGDGDMGIDLVGGVEPRADHQDDDLADIVSQAALAVIARVRSQIALPIAGSCSQGFHGPISAPSSRGP